MERDDRDSTNGTEEDELFTVDKVEFLEKKEYSCSNVLQEPLELLKQVDAQKPMSHSKQRERTDVKCMRYRRLVKIVENILLSPWDRQKRRIRETNPVYVQHIANDQQVLDVLLAIGFRHIGGFIVMQVVNVPYLRDVYRKLIGMLREEYGVEIKSLEGHFFDPFKAYKHDSDVYKNANKEDFEFHGKDHIKRQIEDIKHKLADADIETTLNSWSPKVYLDGAKGTVNERDHMKDMDTSDQKHSAAHVMKVYNVGKCDDFESASRKHLDTLKRQYDHLEKRQTVELKIRLPGGTTLIIKPPMKTPVAKLKTEIQSILTESITLDSWDLVEMPTRRTLDESKTLIQQDISHKVILHFRFKGE
ncbi:hypothetical protein X943_002118 [Babesia divergens]|uniref:PUB domain-containing protein n=1 Tax=Babesia divergens TaxID=32595 RepID=A0AAD9GD56_BABDI|nr:hypothetical protein X943_002118 [Babesia divergens]